MLSWRADLEFVSVSVSLALDSSDIVEWGEARYNQDEKTITSKGMRTEDGWFWSWKLEERKEEEKKIVPSRRGESRSRGLFCF